MVTQYLYRLEQSAHLGKGYLECQRAAPMSPRKKQIIKNSNGHILQVN